MNEIVENEIKKVGNELGPVKTNAILLINAGIGALIAGVLLYLEDTRK